VFNDTLLLAFHRNESENFNGNVLQLMGDSKLPFIAIIAESVPTDGGNWYPQATINS
jgi:hypothetical protein